MHEDQYKILPFIWKEILFSTCEGQTYLGGHRNPKSEPDYSCQISARNWDQGQKTRYQEADEY